MLKYVDYDIVFQEIPDEVTLAINISNCPFTCIGCHSPFLREDIGEELAETQLSKLVDKYGKDITCVSFMGGDGDLQRLVSLATFVKNTTSLKVAWYTGRESFPKNFQLNVFDYIKIGPYKQELGPLNKETTNQRLYHIEADGQLKDITCRFWKK